MVDAMDKAPPEQFNFQDVQFLIFDRNRISAKVLSEVLQSFGAPEPYIVDNVELALQFISLVKFDAALVALGHQSASDVQLIQVIRHLDTATRFIPIVGLAASPQAIDVISARDAGANAMLKRPTKPAMLFDKIVQMAKTERLFVEAGSYFGPDRRYRGANIHFADRRQ